MVMLVVVGGDVHLIFFSVLFSALQTDGCYDLKRAAMFFRFFFLTLNC